MIFKSNQSAVYAQLDLVFSRERFHIQSGRWHVVTAIDREVNGKFNGMQYDDTEEIVLQAH